MRVAVVGSSGSGKTTLAKRLEDELGLPRIELDAINWGPDWLNRSVEARDDFIADVDAAIGAATWVCDGNYEAVRLRIWARATHLIWLDFDRSVIMPRLFKRSLQRALDKTELWEGTGNREQFGKWLEKDHPLRWAWDTWARRRRQFEELLAQPAFGHLAQYRVGHPRDLEAAITALKAAA